MAVRILKDGPHILVSLSLFEQKSEAYFSLETDVHVSYLAPSARMVYSSRTTPVLSVMLLVGKWWNQGRVITNRNKRMPSRYYQFRISPWPPGVRGQDIVSLGKPDRTLLERKANDNHAWPIDCWHYAERLQQRIMLYGGGEDQRRRDLVTALWN